MLRRKKQKEPVQHFMVEMPYGKDKLAERLNHGWEAGWTRIAVMPRGDSDGFTVVWFTQHGFGRD